MFLPCMFCGCGAILNGALLFSLATLHRVTHAKPLSARIAVFCLTGFVCVGYALISAWGYAYNLCAVLGSGLGVASMLLLVQPQPSSTAVCLCNCATVCLLPSLDRLISCRFVSLSCPTFIDW